MQYELPESWVWSSMEKIATSIQYGYTESAKDKPVGPNFLRITDIQDGQVNWDSVPFCICSEEEHSKYLLQPDDIVFARTGATTGKSYLIRDCPDAVFASYLIRLRFENLINRRYISMFLNSPLYWSQIMVARQGSAQPGVNATNLAALQVPVPPISEQQRIVSAIEQQFSRLDAAVTSLQHARAKLKRQRAAILKAAVEGMLTADWRAQHPASETAEQLLQRILHERRAKWEAEQLGKKKVYKEPETPDTTSLPELSEGWCWANLAQVVSRSEYGTSVKCDYEAQGMPVLRIPNIAAGEIDLSGLKYSTLPLNISRDDALQPGDLLVCRTNGSISLIGKTALVRMQLDVVYTYASYLLRFRLFETNILPKWLHLFLTSMQGRRFIESNAASSAGQHNISLTLMHSMVFPLPPLSEQAQIVSEVEARLSIIAQTELEVETNLKRAERLRQTILAEAFAGRLVPQDPDDEPASVLLERIRGERDGMQKKGKAGNGRAVRVPDEPVKIDVEGTRQVELWESVGG